MIVRPELEDVLAAVLDSHLDHPDAAASIRFGDRFCYYLILRPALIATYWKSDSQQALSALATTFSGARNGMAPLDHAEMQSQAWREASILCGRVLSALKYRRAELRHIELLA